MKGCGPQAKPLGEFGVSKLIDQKFWHGRRVFLTGHTGFKGSWLALWLENLGAIVHGYALAPDPKRSLFCEAGLELSLTHVEADIRDLPKLRQMIGLFDPQIVIHMAAQPLVMASYREPVDTFAVNVMGTVNVLACLECCPSLQAALIVTSDKCYQNQELEAGYREDHPMGGHDPYSSSKACAELVVASWYKSFVQGQGAEDRFALATVRAGNVIGGGDWSEGRLIPDILRAVERGKLVDIRNPQAVRPWQYVLEPLAGYLQLAQHMVEGGAPFSQAWNFGPAREDVKPVGWIVERLLSGLEEKTNWNYVADPTTHETSRLFLDCSKARERLNWEPVYELPATISKIVDWHRAWRAGTNMRQFMTSEINQYLEASDRVGNGS